MKTKTLLLINLFAILFWSTALRNIVSKIFQYSSYYSVLGFQVYPNSKPSFHKTVHAFCTPVMNKLSFQLSCKFVCFFSVLCGASPLEVWQNVVCLSPAGMPWSPRGFSGLCDVIGREHAGVSYQMGKGDLRLDLRESESKTYELTFLLPAFIWDSQHEIKLWPI